MVRVWAIDVYYVCIFNNSFSIEHQRFGSFYFCVLAATSLLFLCAKNVTFLDFLVLDCKNPFVPPFLPFCSSFFPRNGSRGDSIDAAVMSATNADSGGGGVSSGYAGGRSTLAAMDGQREFLSSKAPAEMLAEEIEFEDELTIKEKTIAEIAKDVVSAALRKHGVVSVGFVNEVLDLLPTQNRAFLEQPGGPLAELPAGRTAEVVKAAFDAVGTQLLDVTHRAGVELYVLTTPVWKSKVSAEYRTLILNLLQESKRIKKAAITQTCVSAGLAQIPSNIYQKIVHELAVNTGGQWSLKSGDGN